MAISAGNLVTFNDDAAASHSYNFTVQSADDYIVVRLCNPATDDKATNMLIDAGGADEAAFSRLDANGNDVFVDGGNVTADIWHLPGSLVPAAGTYAISWDIVDSFGSANGSIFALQGAADQPPEDSGTIDNSFGSSSSFNVECNIVTPGAWQLGIVSTAGDTGGGYSARDGQTEDFSSSGSGDSFVMGHVERSETGADVECDWAWTNEVNSHVGAVVAIAPAAAGGGGTIPVISHHYRQQMRG